MIDGGNDSNSNFIYLFLTNVLHLELLNYMIASHPHEDHVDGLAGALNACIVDTLYTPMTEYDTRAFQSMMKYVHQQRTSIIVPNLETTS